MRRSLVFLGLLSVMVASARSDAQRGGAATLTSENGRAVRRFADVVEQSSAPVQPQPTMQEIQRLQDELTQLRELVRQQALARENYVPLRDKLDAVEARLGELELRQAALQLQDRDHAASGGDGGVVLRSGGGLAELRLGGLLQLGFLGQIMPREAHTLAADVGTIDFGATGLGRNEATFALRRARLIASGHLLDPRLQYFVALQGGSVPRERPLLDAYGEFAAHRLLKVRAGLMRIPFARQFNLSEQRTLLVDRSEATTNFYPGRDVGLLLTSGLFDSRRFGALQAQVGAFNGPASASLVDDNLDFLYVARLVYEPFGRLADGEGDHARTRRPKVALGSSWLYNLLPTDAAERAGATDPAEIARLRDFDGNGKRDNVARYAMAGELTAHWFGLASQSEIFYQVEDPGAAGSSRHLWGLYSQLGFYHPSGFEVGAQYGFWQVQRFGLQRDVVTAGRVHQVAATVATWFLQEQARAQVQYAHRWLRDLQDAAAALSMDHLSAHVIEIQTQIAF